MKKSKVKPGPESAMRGDQTARRLLQVGLEIFSRFGLAGVTTRKLAQAAKVNIAAIGYHFGGKEQYYLAVMRYIVQERAKPMWDTFRQFQDRLPAVQGRPREARALLCGFLAAMTNNILLHPDGTRIAGIIGREQLHATPAFDILYEGMLRPMHEMLATLVGTAIGRPAEAQETILTAHALLGQVLAFRLAQTTVLRRLHWEALTPPRAQVVAECVAQLANDALAGRTLPSARSAARGRKSK